MQIHDDLPQNEQEINRGMLIYTVSVKKVWSKYTASVRFRTRGNSSFKQLEYREKFDTAEEVLDDLHKAFIPAHEEEYLKNLSNFMEICTFSEYCDRFFNRIVFHFDWDTKERSTAYQYERTVVNQLSDAFGTIRFIDIDKKACDEAFQQLKNDFIKRKEKRLGKPIPENNQEALFADRLKTFENILYNIFNYAIDIAQHRRRKNPIKKVALSHRLTMLTRSVRNELNTARQVEQ